MRQSVFCAGVDPSLGGCGVAVIGPGILSTWRLAEKSRGDAVKDRLDRYLRLADRIANQLEHATRRGVHGLLAIEGYSFGSRDSQSHKTGEFGGLLRLELSGRGWPIIEVPPASLKRFLAGKGNASKGDMMAAARERYGLTREHSHDEADAVGLAAIAAILLGHAKPKTETELEVAADLRSRIP